MKVDREPEDFIFIYDSDIGPIEIRGTEEGITALNFTDRPAPSQPADSTAAEACLQDCLKQIEEYFRGMRKEFSVRLKVSGTDFQKSVWKELMKIPYGQTSSYGEIAGLLGNPKAVRAVGGAVGSNPVSIIIPCHRVLGSGGSLTGFGGGLWRKAWLLKHEGRKFSGYLPERP
jgi:methylated-DNA-[protein]-cysteine S-methyltransferase